METPAVVVQDLSKRFTRPLAGLRARMGARGPNHVDALREVNLEIPAGSVFGLVGRNGQGKTTLIKSICGLLEPTHGSVRVFGFDSVRDAREVKRRVGLVSADERSFYFRLTGRENLRFFGRLLALPHRALEARIEALAETFELLPALDRRFQDYSSGNKQRLSIARALLADPPLLLLDEPTRSLDPLSAEGLRRVIGAWAQGGAPKTVIITTHNLAEVEQLCARVAILSRGRVIACAPLADLKAAHLGDEQVHLTVSGALSEGLRAQLEAMPGVHVGVAGEGGLRVSLSRRAGDERLDALLRALLLAGLRVEGVQAEQAGLVDILSRVEAEERAREQGAPAVAQADASRGAA